MKYNLLFYAEQAKILNNYNELNKRIIDDIINNYKVNVIPDNFIIYKRTNNYFVHSIDKIQMDYLKQLPYLIDNKLYKTSSKTSGIKQLGKNTTMYEKDLCKEIWFASFYKETNYPFDIIDIQTPLKRSNEIKYGELDLTGVSINGNDVTIHLVEVKSLSTMETLLRATLESITYKYIIDVNKSKFIEDLVKYIKKYNGKGKQALIIKENLIRDVKMNFIIKPLVLVPKKLYEHEYAKYIYEKYNREIDYYYIDYNESFIKYYSKDKRKPSLFKEDKYPIINKWINETQ